MERVDEEIEESVAADPSGGAGGVRLKNREGKEEE